jgi:4-aminobutyrate aminotransferase-like enzyme
MSKKPFEVLLGGVADSRTITPKNRQGLAEFLTHEHPGNVLFTKWDEPPIIERGRGCHVWDVDGRQYIDCIAGFSTMNIGHGDQRIAEVLATQYMKLSHWFDFPTPERLKLIKRLVELTPGRFAKRVRLGLSGSDAIEQAIRAARYHTRKAQLISFYGGYHGQTAATMGLTAAGAMHRWFSPVPPADHCIERFPYAYCYRCNYGKEYPSCDLQCTKALDQLLGTGQTSLGNPMAKVGNVAALIVEPMQSSSGYIVPPDEFLRELRRIADKYGFYLIFDEVQTGMGRTGKLFASEHSGAVPDVTVIGKALGGGEPMSAAVARAEIFDDLAPGQVVSTYAGSALGCAVSNKVLDILAEDRLVENAASVGQYVANVVEGFQRAHPSLGSYSLKGLFLGMEFVKDRKTKEPATAETRELVNRMRDEGLLAQLNGYYNNRISFIPPLTVTRKDVDAIFSIMDRCTGELEKKHRIGS